MKNTLSEIEVVYADSRGALEIARKQGLNPNAEVRSFSPSLILNPDFSVKAADGHMTSADMESFNQFIYRWVGTTYDEILNKTGDSELALIVARTIRYFQTKAYKFSILKEADFHRPVAQVIIDTESSAKDRLFNAPFHKVLSVNPQFREIVVAEAALPYPLPTHVPPLASFRRRLSFADWRTMVYRLLMNIWERLPLASPKGTVLILQEGPLLKETAFHLARRGFGIRRLSLNGSSGSLVENPLSDERLKMLCSILRPELASFLAPSAVDPALALLIKEIQGDVQLYQSSLSGWRKRLSSLAGARPRFVLSNKLYRPSEMALCRVCRELGIPVAGFQHGVTREIVAYGEMDDALTETAVADLFFTYNPEMTRVIAGCRFSKGTPITVGMEKDLRRAGRLPKKIRNAEPLWYISTAVYMGNVQPVNRGMSDVDTAGFEMNIVGQVLSRLPHRVLYKPYPAHRYPDTDPIMLKVKESNNIKIYEGGTDLRYLISSCRVLITSRPYSTLGWCILSGKPVVFIDVPGRPLASYVLEKISKGLFYVDGRGKEGLQQLLNLLSLPIEQIEREWTAKNQARFEMTEEFFDGGRGNAGVRAAEILIGRFSSRNSRKN